MIPGVIVAPLANSSTMNSISSAPTWALIASKPCLNASSASASLVARYAGRSMNVWPSRSASAWILSQSVDTNTRSIAAACLAASIG